MKTKLLILSAFVFALLFGCTQTVTPVTNSTNITTQPNISMTQNTSNMSAMNTSMPNVYVMLETTSGNITLELYPNQAPTTVANFVEYVNDGFYDGTIFHRVIKNFIVQGGGLLPDGTPKITRDPIDLEYNSLSNTYGTLAMARTQDPNSATSQFYINLANNTNLDSTSTQYGYVVFGKVVSGMDVVLNISNAPTSIYEQYTDWPANPTIITRAYVTNDSN